MARRSDEILEREGCELLGNLPKRRAACPDGDALFDPALGSLRAFKWLGWGYEWSLGQSNGSASHFATADQLQALHQAALDFKKALQGLQLPAYHALRFPSDHALDDLWRRAAGKPWLAKSDPWDGTSKEDARGSLASKFDLQELGALAEFARVQARRWGQDAPHFRGAHSVFEARHGSTTSQLAQASADALKACSQPLDNLKQLVHLVHEYVTGERPGSRWAEREIQVVKKAHTSRGELSA